MFLTNLFSGYFQVYNSHMLKKRIAVSFFFLLFFIISNLNSNVSAKSGCCSGHDGVNCGAGAQGSGKVICNDGWKGSSCLYSEMVMCGGASSSQPAATATPTKIAPISTPKATYTPKPTVIPTYTKTPTPTPKPTKAIITCSATKDLECPSNCSAGNDVDCCNNNNDYHWLGNKGCYPRELNCSEVSDGKCDWYCSAGNDADCCEQKLDGYTWYKNYGCYTKQEAQCSGIADNICPSNCDNGWDADCCEQNLTGYKWYENWGCYEK